MTGNGRITASGVAVLARTAAVVGAISFALGLVVLFVVLWRTGFGAQEAFHGVLRADWPMPAIMPVIGTVLSGLMLWRQIGDPKRWLKEAAPALAAGYVLAVGLWVLVAQLVNGASA